MTVDHTLWVNNRHYMLLAAEPTRHLTANANLQNIYIFTSHLICIRFRLSETDNYLFIATLLSASWVPGDPWVFILAHLNSKVISSSPRERHFGCLHDHDSDQNPVISLIVICGWPFIYPLFYLVYEIIIVV